MRKLTTEEKRKRGCEYCLYAKMVKGWQAGKFYTKRYLACRYDKCPFSDLNTFKTYREYLKSKGELYIDDERRR